MISRSAVINDKPFIQENLKSIIAKFQDQVDSKSHLYPENHIKLINALNEKLKVINSPVQEGVLPPSNIPLETYEELLRAQAIYKNPIGLAIKSKVEYEDKYAKINQLNQIFDEISSGKDTYRSF